MGCSLTEGVGCYDINTIPKKMLNSRKTASSFKEYYSIYDLNLERFHERGWPNQLGRKLGYDKVLNLGYGGSSTSGQVKNFIDKYSSEMFTDWEVLVIFMLPEPARISFYIDNQIKNFIPSQGLISKAYIDSINNIKYDPILEQIFYIKILEDIFKNRNFNFIYFNHDSKINEFINKLHPSHNNLKMTTNYETHNSSHELNTKYFSPICYHPNELGYAAMVKKMYSDIYNQFPQYIGEPKNEIEWEWNGLPKDYIHIIESIEKII